MNKIDAPSHYVDGRKIQPIDVIEDWDLDFCRANVIKYIARAGRKANEPQGCNTRATGF